MLPCSANVLQYTGLPFGMEKGARLLRKCIRGTLVPKLPCSLPGFEQSNGAQIEGGKTTTIISKIHGVRMVAEA